jgi:hypothetical protein
MVSYHHNDLFVRVSEPVTISSRVAFACCCLYTVPLKNKVFGRKLRRTHADPWVRKEVFI